MEKIVKKVDAAREVAGRGREGLGIIRKAAHNESICN